MLGSHGLLSQLKAHSKTHKERNGLATTVRIAREEGGEAISWILGYMGVTRPVSLLPESTFCNDAVVLRLNRGSADRRCLESTHTYSIGETQGIMSSHICSLSTSLGNTWGFRLHISDRAHEIQNRTFWVSQMGGQYRDDKTVRFEVAWSTYFVTWSFHPFLSIISTLASLSFFFFNHITYRLLTYYLYLTFLMNSAYVSQATYLLILCTSPY